MFKFFFIIAVGGIKFLSCFVKILISLHKIALKIYDHCISNTFFQRIPDLSEIRKHKQKKNSSPTHREFVDFFQVQSMLVGQREVTEGLFSFAIRVPTSMAPSPPRPPAYVPDDQLLRRKAQAQAG